MDLLYDGDGLLFREDQFFVEGDPSGRMCLCPLVGE